MSIAPQFACTCSITWIWNFSCVSSLCVPVASSLRVSVRRMFTWPCHTRSPCDTLTWPCHTRSPFDTLTWPWHTRTPFDTLTWLCHTRSPFCCNLVATTVNTIVCFSCNHKTSAINLSHRLSCLYLSETAITTHQRLHQREPTRNSSAVLTVYLSNHTPLCVTVMEHNNNSSAVPQVETYMLSRATSRNVHAQPCHTSKRTCTFTHTIDNVGQ